MPRNLVSEGFTHKVRVTIESGKFTAAHSNFYLRLTGANFPAGYFSTCGGYQHLVCGVATSDDTNVTELDRDVFNFTPGSSTQEIWIRIPTCPTASAYEIDIYIRASGGSEPQKTSGMWPSSTHILASIDGISDRSANAHTMTPGDTATTASGPNGFNILDFGSAGHVTLPAGLLDGLNTVTLQGWHKWTNVVGTHGLWGAWPSDKQLLARINISTHQLFQYTTSSSGGTYSGFSRANNTWYRYTEKIDTTGMRMYQNGSLSTTSYSSGTLSTPGLSLRIGGDNSANISEYDGVGLGYGFQITKIAKSDALVADEYTNQNAPGSFYSVGSLTAVSGAAPTRRRMILSA